MYSCLDAFGRLIRSFLESNEDVAGENTVSSSSNFAAACFLFFRLVRKTLTDAAMENYEDVNNVSKTSSKSVGPLPEQPKHHQPLQLSSTTETLSMTEVRSNRLYIRTPWNHPFQLSMMLVVNCKSDYLSGTLYSVNLKEHHLNFPNTLPLLRLHLRL